MCRTLTQEKVALQISTWPLKTVTPILFLPVVSVLIDTQTFNIYSTVDSFVLNLGMAAHRQMQLELYANCFRRAC